MPDYRQLTIPELDRIAEQIQRTDFEHPFTLYPYGDVVDAPPGIHAPEAYLIESGGPWSPSNPDIDLAGGEDEWEPLAGMTGQYRYHGPIMHTSEYVGRAIAQRLADEASDAPQTLVLVVVEVHPDEEDSEPQPAGWAILKRVESGLDTWSSASRQHYIDTGRFMTPDETAEWNPDDPGDLHSGLAGPDDGAELIAGVLYDRETGFEIETD